MVGLQKRGTSINKVSMTQRYNYNMVCNNSIMVGYQSMTQRYNYNVVCNNSIMVGYQSMMSVMNNMVIVIMTV